MESIRESTSINMLHSSRSSFENKQMTLQNLFDLWKDGDLDTQPPGQREQCWPIQNKVRFIETCMLGLPTPSIFLLVKEDSTYDVLDGQQRLSSCFKFIRNEFSLSSKYLELQESEVLSGHSYDTLKTDKELKSVLKSFMRYSFSVVEVHSNSMPVEYVSTLFERLNAGGLKLTSMEIRRYVYNGPLMAFLEKLSSLKCFRQVLFPADTAKKQQKRWENLKKRGADLEYILGFLMLYEKSPSFLKGPLNKSIDRYCEEFYKMYKYDPEAASLRADTLEKAFVNAMKSAYTIFGKHAFNLFKRTGDSWTYNSNRALFRIIGPSLAKYSRSLLTEASNEINDSYIALLRLDDKFVDHVKVGSANQEHICYLWETWRTRLESIMKSYPNLDSKRCYSPKIKQDLYDQDPRCCLCKNEISTIFDASVDHIIPYCVGGETTESNARLVHRLCNQKRGARIIQENEAA